MFLEKHQVSHLGNLKVIENGNTREAKTDLETSQLLTEISSRTHQIILEENQDNCMETEHMVETTLIRNTDKITPKIKINLNEIRVQNIQALPFNPKGHTTCNQKSSKNRSINT